MAASGLDSVSMSPNTLTQANPLSTLPAGNNPLEQNVYNTIGSQVSGEAYQPYQQSTDEAMARAAANLRAQTGAATAPNLGQGAAVAAQQGTEQNIMSQLSTTQLQEEQQKEAMKNAGIQNYLQNETLGINEANLQIQQATESSRAYWDTSHKLSEYAQTHLDLTDPTSDPAAMNLMAQLYQSQTGQTANPADPQFKSWAQQQWGAARDSRLTNPIDESIYQINSAQGLTDAERTTLRNQFVNSNLGTTTVATQGSSQFTAQVQAYTNGTSDISTLAGYSTSGDANKIALYNAVLGAAAKPSATGSSDNAYFSNMPVSGSSVNIGGKLYKVSGSVRHQQPENADQVEVIDENGNVHTARADWNGTVIIVA